MGALLARLGRREEAREHIAIFQTAFQAEQEARLREASRRARLNLGWVELRQGRAERALEQFRRFPDDVEALRGAARALSKLGRHGEAAKTYERALTVSPEDPRLRYELDAERTTLKKKAR
jgi:tetratricopeptide (TPR) repeat protein